MYASGKGEERSKVICTSSARRPAYSAPDQSSPAAPVYETGAERTPEFRSGLAPRRKNTGDAIKTKKKKHDKKEACHFVRRLLNAIQQRKLRPFPDRKKRKQAVSAVRHGSAVSSGESFSRASSRYRDRNRRQACPEGCGNESEFAPPLVQRGTLANIGMRSGAGHIRSKGELRRVTRHMRGHGIHAMYAC
jgi:hypothetical protein